MIVKYQKGIEFINDCNCIVDYHELSQAIIWYQDRPTSRLKKIYLHGKYPAVTILFEKVHVHRLLMQYWEKRKLSTQEYVHHINENKLDSSKGNLEILSASSHQSLTNKGRKQSKIHVMKRANATTITRYGHSIYENPDLLK